MIQVRNLNKTYDRHHHNANQVLRDVSFDLPDTGFVCILGPSGCGKTSLLNAIGGLDTFDNGILSTEQVSVSRYGTTAYERERNRNFGYIFQNYFLLEDHSVAYNVYLGLHSLDMTHREKLERVRMALKAVEMERYTRRKVGELSGGQQQRVAIARALARRPKVIFADEPTGNLDEANTRNICTLLRQASKDSLVIMVTHEERIARFFADRIITLESGQIRSDDTSWKRGSLSADSDKVIYAGDHADLRMQTEGVSLRLIREEGAEPVELTVVALNDRIVIKLSDQRPVSLSTSDDTLRIEEGTCPVMTLESIDRTSGGDSALFQTAASRETGAGKGLTGRMMFQEARSLLRGKGIRRTGLRGFLVLLTVLALLITGDLAAISRVDPEDFIVHDSHILKVQMERGNNTDPNMTNAGSYDRYWQYMASILKAEGYWIQEIPLISTLIECSTELFYQLGDELLTIPACSQVPLSQLPENSLIFGRMPQNSWEIVADRTVLEAALAVEGEVQNSIGDITFFLDNQIQFGRKDYTPTVVGICDSGERSIYMSLEAMTSVCSSGTSVITLSELQSLVPGVYDDLVLGSEECAVFLNNAGVYYQTQVGRGYKVGSDLYFNIVSIHEEPAVPANIVVADDMVEYIIRRSLNTSITVYCNDKQGVTQTLKQLALESELSDLSAELAALAAEHSDQTEDAFLYQYLSEHPEEATDELWLWFYVNSDLLEITTSDPYAETLRAYEAAASVRVDGRWVVSVTLIGLSLVMLYLLCRSQVRERLELLAVYRLLGIPGKKLYGIFLLEGLMASARTILPAAVLTWASVEILKAVPEVQLDLILTPGTVLAVSLAILGYYLAVSVLPLLRLLKLPPARLAAKYDI